MPIRPAQLEDTHAIAALHRAMIERWQTLSPEGQVRDLPYDSLTIYERWKHGGAWMSDETAVLWLSHLLRNQGVVMVLEDPQEGILAYCEGIVWEEPAPFGKHLHLKELIARPGYAELRDTLMQSLLTDIARYGQLTVGVYAHDADTTSFYARYGFTPLASIQRHTLSTQAGQGFFRTTDHPDANSAQIRGWQMLSGRHTSSRIEWERQWASVWDAVPQIVAERTHRLKFNVAGQDAFLCFHQDVYNTRVAEVFCWSNKAFSSPLLVAIRDWAHRNGYRSLVLWGDASVGKVIGNEGEVAPSQLMTLARRA